MNTNRTILGTRAVCMCVLSLLLSISLSTEARTRGKAAAEEREAGSDRTTLWPAEMTDDFNQMRHAFEEAHPGLYRYSPKAEMDRIFDTERAKLNVPLTKLEFLSVLSETVAKIKCGHTKVDGDHEVVSAMKDAPQFPLEVLVEGERLFVLLNDTANDQSIRPGMEITRINGENVGEILARMFQDLPTDGDIESNKRTHAESNFARYYWTLSPNTRQFVIEVKDGQGRTLTATLAGVTDDERKKNQNPVNTGMQESLSRVFWTNENVALRFVKEPDIAEIRIDHFVGDDFPTWIEHTFRKLREMGTKSLIIDLRGNGGGKDMYGALLVSYLTDKPFRYFDHINIKTVDPSFRSQVEWSESFAQKLREGTVPNPAGGFLATPKLHEGLSEQLPAKYRFKGKVFVLTDGGTFSTAADFCAVAHHLKLAKFIGEETGGGYYGNNSGLVVKLTLQHSKFEVELPMYEYWNAVTGNHGERRGTVPDYAVSFSTADLLRGVDAQLTMAEKLATR